MTSTHGDPLRIEWRFPARAARLHLGPTELSRQLAEKIGYPLSPPHACRLLAGEPDLLRLALLAALCELLRCTPGDLLRLTSRPPGPNSRPPVPEVRFE